MIKNHSKSKYCGAVAWNSTPPVISFNWYQNPTNLTVHWRHCDASADLFFDYLNQSNSDDKKIRWDRKCRAVCWHLDGTFSTSSYIVNYPQCVWRVDKYRHNYFPVGGYQKSCRHKSFLLLNQLTRQPSATAAPYLSTSIWR